jgi:hypothetical protein
MANLKNTNFVLKKKIIKIRLPYAFENLKILHYCTDEVMMDSILF